MSHHTEIDNNTLIEECRKGDKEALNLFYLRFAPRMLSVIRRYVTDIKDAEDILHDGFIIAFTRLNSLRESEKVEYWLATIMRNLSLRFLQSQDLAQVLHNLPEVEDTPQIDDIIDLATLESLIKKLPAGYQKVFRLAVLEKKSHKEIAKLLGIAPNSSSSQLFHAKLMMRKLITDYKKQTGVFCLLLIGLGIGSIWYNHDRNSSCEHRSLAVNTTRSTRIISKSPESGQVVPAAKSQQSGNATMISKVVSSDAEESIGPGDEIPKGEELIKPVEVTDSVITDSVSLPHDDRVYYAYLQDRDLSDHDRVLKSDQKDWSVRISTDAGMFAFNGKNSSEEFFSNLGPGGIWGGPGDIPVDLPDDNPVELPNDPEDKDDLEKPDTRSGGISARRAAAAFKDYKNSAHTNYLPLSFSVAVNKKLNTTFSVESGLTYTYLHTVFEGLSSVSNCHWHYLGVPLRINAGLFSYNRVRTYATVGGVMNIPLYSEARVKTFSGNPEFKSGEFKSPVVWSFSASLGLSIRLGKNVDVFLEPTLQYNFDHSVKVPNVWSDESWGFSLPIGFRFNL